ncbi:AbrB/MazE/SpoVT family DNA-binding domain-containing protein [Mycobacterium gordonae]|nr:AbrB/MazE/SpoVT family DNA-binding domain-containing protein [Mycobacterium gordonae]
MEMTKKVGKGGGVTLPAALRREIGLEAGEPLTVTVQTDGALVLRRTQPKCILTGAEHDLIVYGGKYVSRTAIIDMFATMGGAELGS